MNKYDVMWKCPNCGEIISNALYMMRRTYGVCDCNKECYYWKFDKFVLDRDDKISPPINMETVIENAIEEVLAEELEKSYRDGYSRGFEEGADEGHSKGYNEGYKKAIRIY